MQSPVKRGPLGVFGRAAGAVVALSGLAAVQPVRSALAADAETRFNLAGGFLVPTVLSIDGELVSANPGPLVLVSFDRPLDDSGRFDWGGFLDVGSFSAGSNDEQVNLMQIGLVLHWGLPDTWGGLLRLGTRIGYRQLYADARGYDGVRGLAVDLTAQFIKSISTNLTGQLEVGVLSQPVGGNAHGQVYFGPFPYLALGVVL